MTHAQRLAARQKQQDEQRRVATERHERSVERASAGPWQPPAKTKAQKQRPNKQPPNAHPRLRVVSATEWSPQSELLAKFKPQPQQRSPSEQRFKVNAGEASREVAEAILRACGLPTDNADGLVWEMAGRAMVLFVDEVRAWVEGRL